MLTFLTHVTYFQLLRSYYAHIHTEVSKHIALPFFNPDAEKDSFLGFFLFHIDAKYFTDIFAPP